MIDNSLFRAVFAFGMVLVRVCLALAVVALAAASASESRIMGGTPLTIEEFPYVASILYLYPGPGITIQRCVGTIISSFHVITAAFCFTGAVLENMSIRVGSTNTMSGGNVYGVADVVKHPSYTETPRGGDIAVIFVAGVIGITPTTQNIFIPTQDEYLPDWTQTQVVGWGFESEGVTTPNDLMKTISVSMLPLAQCQLSYDGYDGVTIDDPVICGYRTSTVGVCAGDHGAPMAIGRHLIGISSYHVGCGSEGHPDVYTRVDRYTNWILQVTSGQARVGNKSDLF